jgi:inorganic pyrophosphatase
VPKKKNSGGQANPIFLAPFDKKTDALQVIIETPKGSRNKYAFEAEPFSATPDFR